MLQIMYNLPYYKEEDAEKIIAFMQQNSFAVITGAGENYPVATHIPLAIEIVDGKILLKGHLMKKTDHHIAFENNENVLVIFNGPHCYVSASWYTNALQGSTWNYMTVHAKGKIKFTDEQGTYNAVKAITNKYEGANAAGSFANIPQTYIDQMVKAIVGFTIEVQSLENVFKLSQNRDEQSKKTIIENLIKRGDENSIKIAKEMEKR
jgi:transcriptional regulator